MSIVTRGLGGSGGFGARTLLHNIDLFVIRRPVQTHSIDMIVGPALPSSQNTLLHDIDLWVLDARTVRTDVDILVIDSDGVNAGQWNDVII